MDDYISREAALKAIFDSANSFLEDEDPAKASTMIYLIATSNAREAVKGIPNADVRPVIPAQWIALDIYRSEGNYKCSNCGQPCYVPECMGEPMYSVCPNCGADMGGSEDGT